MNQRNFHFLLTAILLGFVCSLFAPKANAQNLLTNGGFDTGNFTGWSGNHPNGWNFGQDGDPNVWAVDGLNPQAGDFAAKNFYDGGIYQTVSIAGGHAYTFSGAAFVPSGGSINNWGSFVQLQLLNSNNQILGTVADIAAQNLPRNQWDTFNVTFNAPNAAVSALLKIGTYTNTGVTPANPTEFDSFSITPVAEPMTYVLFVMGIVAMIPVIRRRLKISLSPTKKIQSAVAASALLVALCCHAEDPKPVQKLPFYTFSDKMDHFVPSGWMGDTGDLSINNACKEKPAKGEQCIKVQYSAKASQGNKWAGVYWQEPSNNWGTVRGGGFNLTGAKKLKFMARGEKGGEIVEFKGGGISGEFPDTFRAEAPLVPLTPVWKEYVIDVSDLDLSTVIGGFVFAVSQDKNPKGCTFYLDEIRYE